MRRMIEILHIRGGKYAASDFLRLERQKRVWRVVKLLDKLEFDGFAELTIDN